MAPESGSIASYIFYLYIHLLIYITKTLDINEWPFFHDCHKIMQLYKGLKASQPHSNSVALWFPYLSYNFSAICMRFSLMNQSGSSEAYPQLHVRMGINRFSHNHRCFLMFNLLFLSLYIFLTHYMFNISSQACSWEYPSVNNFLGLASPF